MQRSLPLNLEYQRTRAGYQALEPGRSILHQGKFLMPSGLLGAMSNIPERGRVLTFEHLQRAADSCHLLCIRAHQLFQRARDIHFARTDMLGEVHHSWQCCDTFHPLHTILTFKTSIVPRGRKIARGITPRKRVPSFSFDGPLYMKRRSPFLRSRTSARSQLAWR